MVWGGRKPDAILFLDRLALLLIRFLFVSLDMQIQTDIIDGLEFSVTDYEREMGEGLFTLDELPL